MPAGQEHEQQNAERVDVGRRRDGSARTCSGAAYSGVSASGGIVRELGPGPLHSASSSLPIPKSSSLICSSALTRMFDGLRSRCTTRLAWACATASATCRNSSSRFAEVRPALVGETVDARAFDVLEHEIRLTRRCHTRVEQASDVRMRQSREQRPFALEAFVALGTEQARG